MNPAALISHLSRRLPAYPASQLFVTGFNLSVWRNVRDLDWQSLYGKQFCVAITDWHMALHFSLTPQGLRATHNTRADVIFSASLQDFIRLALRLEDPDTLFFNRRLLIEGETDIGLQIKNMLDGVEFETLINGLPLPIGKGLLYARERYSKSGG